MFRDDAEIAIYLRVTRKNQVRGFGLRNQLKKAAATVGRLGEEDYRVFEDPGRLGTNMNRKGLKALLTAIAQGEISLLVVYSLCRLSRNTDDLRQIHETLDAHGVRLITVLEGYDSELRIKERFFLIAGHSVGWDVKHRAERTKAAKDDLAKRCIYIGGKAGYGYRIRKGENTLRIENTEATAVRKIFRLHEKDWPDEAIADELKLLKFPSTRKDDWDADQVYRIRQKIDKYRGLFTHKINSKKGTRVIVHFEKSLAIVQDRVWERLCEKYQGIEHKPGKEGCWGLCREMKVKAVNF